MKNISLLKLISIYSFGAFIVFLIFRIILINSFSADIGGIENNVIYSICKTLQGGLLYEDPETRNFNITQYTPIYYYFPIFISKAFNLNPLNDLHYIYIIGRSISLIFNLIGGYFIYKLIHGIFNSDKKIAIVACSIYFLSLTRIHFAARPDSLYSLLFILIIYCFSVYLLSGKDKQKNMYFFIGILLASISIFIKQTGIEYLFIIPSFFLLTRNYKTFFVSSVLLAVSVTIFFFIFYAIYDYAFVSNVVGGLNNDTSLPRVYDVFSRFFLDFQLIFVFGIFSSYIFFIKAKSLIHRFLSFNVITLFGFAVLTSLKEGSWINYYNEFVISVIIISAIEMSRLLSKVDMSNAIHKKSIYFLSLYLVLLLPNIVFQKFYHVHYDHIKAPRSEFEAKQNIAKILNDKLGNKQFFIAFDEHINSMLPLKSVIPNKDLVPSQSIFNYNKFNEAIKTGTVHFVVLPTKKSTFNFMGHDFSKFKITYRDNDFMILENNFR